MLLKDLALRLLVVLIGIGVAALVVWIPVHYWQFKLDTTSGRERELAFWLSGVAGFIWFPLSILVGAVSGGFVTFALWPRFRGPSRNQERIARSAHLARTERLRRRAESSEDDSK